MYFPKWFTPDFAYTGYLKEYILTKIALIYSPESEEVAEQMKDICDYFLMQSKPKSFIPTAKDNIIIQSDKQLESVCANLEESGINTENITVFSFYSKIEHFEKRYNELKNHGNRGN